MTETYLPQIPATLDDANVKLERYASLASQLATSEEARETAHADTNAVAEAAEMRGFYDHGGGGLRRGGVARLFSEPPGRLGPHP